MDLKSQRERKIGFSFIFPDTLSANEINSLLTIIENLRNIPDFEIFKIDPVSQKEIFGVVRNACV